MENVYNINILKYDLFYFIFVLDKSEITGMLDGVISFFRNHNLLSYWDFIFANVHLSYYIVFPLSC